MTSTSALSRFTAPSGVWGHEAAEKLLPLRLYWSSADRAFDLGKPYMRRWYYQTVLREASRLEDLTDHLDRDTMIGL